ncbi:hypothetical protein ATSB10_14840 [Dyella thiooxydans]|uniref:Uncharacterized protein n=1 Tax=Dyella thiooxydans TaxID=445710 RepID=A0A160N103_9GAMM|nr:hypothetical protein [Dyella thiooxydans]AND68938.1 hypothetical protein ATSB10_14840 [Dyella thiooxydans]
MKHTIVAAIVTFGFACVPSISAAQDQTTELQDVTVTGLPAPYGVYVVDFDTGYGLKALVGHTHRQYMHAQRAAAAAEAMRKRGLAMSPYVTVAIDNSGSGLAKQIQLMDAGWNTVAIVNVYCKGGDPSRGRRCKLVSVPVSGSAPGPRMASTLSVAAVDEGG